MKKLIPMIVFGIVALHTNHVVNANEIIGIEEFSNIVDYEDYINSFVSYEEDIIKVNDVVSFGIPILSENTRISYDEDINFILESSETALSMIIDVNPMLKNSELLIPLNFKNGESIELAQDEDGNTDGSMLMRNRYGESIGVIHVETLGEDAILIPTTETHNNMILIDMSSLQGIDELNQIKIDIRANTINDYFSSRRWIMRDMASLSLTHKPRVFLSIANRNHSWELVHYYHSRDPLWKITGNDNGMRDQYLCHWDVLGPLKNPYNIEPARPDVGYIQTVIAQCNPDW